MGAWDFDAWVEQPFETASRARMDCPREGRMAPVRLGVLLLALTASACGGSDGTRASTPDEPGREDSGSAGATADAGGRSEHPASDGAVVHRDAGAETATPTPTDASSFRDRTPPGDAASCEPGHGDCNGNRAADGCEVDLNVDPAHCGGCDRACTAPPNAAATCMAASCGSRCLAGFGDCNGDPTTDGCEVDLTIDPAHCGGCDRACTAPPNAAATCMAASCGSQCVAGFGDCNGDPTTDGCEVDLTTDPAHCGACAHPCPSVENAVVTCVGAACESQCSAGFDDCNHDRATDGCEVELATEVSNCGACGHACQAVPNAAATCTNGSCGTACLPGYADCERVSSDGCETDVNDDPDDCGGCGRICSSRNMATRTCVSGTCAGTCLSGFADCNGDKLSDGCERPVTDDVANCGGCNVVCRGVVGRGCARGVCNATCDDGIANQGESDVDCGGPCVACRIGKRCSVASDCKTGACRASLCAPLTCPDGYGLPGPPRIEAKAVPAGVAVGDFNADGRPDVAITNFTDDSVTVALGVGHGVFGTPVNYTTGSGPRNVTAGDVDGDGFDDLVISDNYAASFSVLVADKAGGFAPKADYSTMPGPTGIAIGDVDGDGDRDLVVAGAQGLAVHRNGGGGTFGSATNYGNGTGGQSLSVALGDIDGDGKPDLAVTSNSTGVTVLLNTGGGAFGSATAIGYSVGAPLSVAIADMNGDGRKDVVASGDVFLQQSGGTFTRPGPFDPSILPDPVAIADFNGDGVPDIGGVVKNPANVYVRLNDGSGATALHGSYVGGYAPSGVVASDLDGNGFPDLVVIDEGVHAANVLLNYGGAKFVTRVLYQTGIRPTSFAFGDLDGDGDLDIVTTSSNEFLSSANTASVLLNNGDMSFAPARNYATGKRPISVVVGDLDQDGHPDIVASNWQDKSVSILRNLGDGSFAPYETLAAGDYAKTVLASDFDGDGRLDLVVDTANDIVRVFRNTGSGSFVSTDLVPPGTYFPSGKSQSLAVGDLNGDGHPDLVRIQEIFTTSGSVPTIAKYLNRGNGSFAPPVLTFLPVVPLAVTTGDPWRDGRDQYFLLNEDGTVTAGGRNYATGLSPETIAIGEVDGDGILDIVVGADAAADVFLGRADRTFASAVSYSSQGSEALGLVDFNGDGRSEVLTGNGSYIDVIPNVCLP